MKNGFFIINRESLHNFCSTNVEEPTKYWFLMIMFVADWDGKAPDGTSSRGKIWAKTQDELLKKIKERVNTGSSIKTIYKHIQRMKEYDLISLSKDSDNVILAIKDYDSYNKQCNNYGKYKQSR